MAKAKKQKPPSRVKYEKENPTMSFRMCRADYEEIEDIKEAEGLSNADLILIGAGKVRAQQSRESAIQKIGYDAGYRSGYEEAAKRFKVVFRCKICGQAMEVEHDNVKEAIVRFLNDAGWGHAECHQRKQ